MSNLFAKKIAKIFIPAPLLHVQRRRGIWKMLKMLFEIGLGYTSVFFYLLRKRGIKAAWNFVMIKLFTPVGPGSAGLFWFLLGWLIRKYPLLYRFPKQVEFEIATTCTKKCIHCEHTHWARDTQVRKRLSYDEITNVLEQFPGLRWASLVGEGSSFEHPDMMKLVKYLRKRNIMNYMPEHMSDWTDKTFETILNEDMDGIAVSFDAATKQTYEKLKVGCDFDKVVANLKRLVDEKHKRKSPLPEITFTYIAMKDNVHEIPQYVDLIADISDRKGFGVGSRIGIVRLLAFKQILDLQMEDIPQDIINEAHSHAEKRGVFINFTGTNVREELPAPECCIAWMEPYIFMPGYVSQCCAVFISNNRPFIRKYAHGNLFEEDIKTVWNNKSYKTLRYLINKKDAPIPIQCAHCRVFNTLPREIKYGIINTHNGEIMSLKTFYHEHAGENMKWRYDDVNVDRYNDFEPSRHTQKIVKMTK